MKFIKPLSLAIGTALLTACATTTTPISAQAPNDASSPKTQLGNAVKTQLYSSFSYQTDAYLSNHIHRDALKNSVISDDVVQDCDKAHDTAYVALLKHAKADGQDINDKQYDAQRHALKATYFACMDAQELQKTYEPFDFENFYEQSKGLDEDSQADLFIQNIQEHIGKQTLEVDVPKPPIQDIALDTKKAELLHEYLLKPAHISMVGRYEPFKGKITALPTASYYAKNLLATINQPIYIDIKAGGIYVWADNLALANSQILDKALGDKWYNKWLFIPINDGSLPTSFGKDLVKSYIEAKKESFAVLPESGFAQVSYEQFLQTPLIGETLPKHTTQLIHQTPTIIKNQISPKDKSYSDYVFASTFYDSITAKYPQLLTSRSDFHERTIVEGESVIEITDLDTPKNTDDSFKLDSEFFMKVLFGYLKSKIDGYATDVHQELPASDHAPLTHYGIQQGKLSWLHYRYYLTNKNLQSEFTQAPFSINEPIFVDIFTQIHQNNKDMGEFGRLPTAVQTPNAHNSINLFEYKKDLIQRLKNSDDKYLQMVMGLLLGSDAISEDMQLPDTPDLSEP